jgi:hypothetical protein
MFGRTFRMVAACEFGRKHKCVSCCNGARHGARRFPDNATRNEFEALPDGDPHKLRPPKSRYNGTEEAGWYPSRRTRNGLLMRTRMHLRREARHFRKIGQLEDAQAAAFASCIVSDVASFGVPGLYVGMFYTQDWQWASPQPANEYKSVALQELSE